MALKDCTFFVDVNGKQVEMDYDQFRAYLFDGTNLSALAPALAQKKGAKAGFETAQKAEPAPARAEAPKARAEGTTQKTEAPAPTELEVSAENLRKLMPKLGKRRAEAIIAVMKAMGIPFDRLKLAKGKVEAKGTLQQADVKARDAEYMAAVKAGDTAKAQRMVEEAAKAAGYNETGSHGLAEGKLEGNRFDTARLGTNTQAASARLGFFFGSKETAKTYAKKRLNLDKAEEVASMARAIITPLLDVIPEGRSRELDFVRDNIETVFSPQTYQIEMPDDYVSGIYSEVARLIDEALFVADDYGSTEAMFDAMVKASNKAVSLLKRQSSEQDVVGPNGESLTELAFSKSNLEDNDIDGFSFYLKDIASWLRSTYPEAAKAFKDAAALSSESMSSEEQALRDALRKAQEALDDTLGSVPFYGVIDAAQVNAVLQMSNPFVYDQEGKRYREQTYFDVIRKAKERGHDSVIIKNTYDGGPLDDIKVVFEPRQIKSADPITYDDKGNVIPLSERFKPESPDIRYQKEEAGIPTELRNALTEGALQQSSWKDWYEEHQETLDDFFGDYAQQFQDILSVTSQAASVKANVGLALKAFGQWHRGEAFTGYLPAVRMNLERLRSNSEIQGQKISTYKRNNDGTVDEAVIDRHITRLIFGVDSPSRSQFKQAQDILAGIAREIGWTARQVQAALWAHSIVKSGKTPESYGAYLRKLEAAGTLKQRIGELSKRGRKADAEREGRGRFAPRGPKTLKQEGRPSLAAVERLRGLVEGEVSPLGSITFIDDLNALISVFEKANFSTVLHEAMHFYRRHMLNTENGFTAEEIKRFERWAGAKNGNWTVAAEEKAARAFEKYLRDGLAPIPELKDLFRRVAQWMREVYATLTGSPVDIDIPADIRQVFDRIFTLEAERQGKAGGQAAPAAGTQSLQQANVKARDAEYMAAVKAGDTAKAQKMVDEAARKAGYNTPKLYHGTPSRFYVFDASKIGSNGRMLGPGFYFTTDKNTALGYTGQGGRLVTAYAQSKKPLQYNSKPFNASQVQKLLKSIALIEANSELDGHWRDGFLSGYVYTYGVSLDAAVKEASRAFLNEQKALDQLGGIIGSGVDPAHVNQGLKASLGYDSYTATGYENRGVGGGDIYVLMESDQIKSADPITYDNKGDVIPLSERFKPESPDIRYQKEEKGSSKPVKGPVWRSKVMEALGGWKQNKGTPAQLMAYLDKVKGAAEEAKWIGLKEFLEGKATVTKAQVEDFVSQNPYIVSDNFLDTESLRYANWSVMGGSNYREILLTAPRVPFTSVHFSNEPNYLAHMRVKTFTDTNERQVLLVDEVQSDLHQQGRKLGYLTPEKARQVPALQEELREAYTRLRENKVNVNQIVRDLAEAITEKNPSRYTSIGKSRLTFEIEEFAKRAAGMFPRNPLRRQPSVTGQQIVDFVANRGYIAGSGFTHDIVPALARRAGLHDDLDRVVRIVRRFLRDEQRYRDLQVQIGNLSKMPSDAPFKGSESWGVMVFKRAIRLAVEEGADVIAWTPGKMQQERYGNVNDLVTFYDKILPAALGKFVRQWGGKVETVKLGTASDSTKPILDRVIDEATRQIDYFNEQLEQMYFEEYDSQGRTQREVSDILEGLQNTLDSAPNLSENELHSALRELLASSEEGQEGDLNVTDKDFPAIVITPQMKAEAQKGFTLFQAEGSGADSTAKARAEAIRQNRERMQARREQAGGDTSKQQKGGGTTQQQKGGSSAPRQGRTRSKPQTLSDMLRIAEEQVQAAAEREPQTDTEKRQAQAQRAVMALLRDYVRLKAQGNLPDTYTKADGTQVNREAELFDALTAMLDSATDPDDDARKAMRKALSARFDEILPGRVKSKAGQPKTLQDMLREAERNIRGAAGKKVLSAQEKAQERADQEIKYLIREYAQKMYAGRLTDDLELPDGTTVSREQELLNALDALRDALKMPNEGLRLKARADAMRRVDFALLAPPLETLQRPLDMRNFLTGHAWGTASVRSPLSYLNYIGSYERIAGVTGRQVSDTFNEVRTRLARGQYRNFNSALADLRILLRPLKEQLREEGYRGLPSVINEHVRRIERSARSLGKLTWDNVRKAWMEGEFDFGAHLASSIIKAYVFNALLRFNPRAVTLNYAQSLFSLFPFFTPEEFMQLYKDSITPETQARVRDIAIKESGGRFTPEIAEDAKSKLPNPFMSASEQVRIMGHLAGEMMADRLNLPEGIERDMYIRSWAEKAEFDNSAWNAAPLFTGPLMSVLAQFKPYMFKNLERVFTDFFSKPIPGERVKGRQVPGAPAGVQEPVPQLITARQAKMLVVQLGIGGPASLLTLAPGLRMLIGPIMLGLLAKSFSEAAGDDELGEKLAEIVYFGVPAAFALDLSSSVSFIEGPSGKGLAEKIANSLGPAVSLTYRAYTEGDKIYELATRPQKVGESEAVKKELKERTWKLGKALTPYTRMVEAGYSLATGTRPEMFLDKETPLTTGETIGRLIGGSPVRQASYYEMKEAPDLAKRIVGMQPDIAGIPRERGETDKTYRVKVQRVTEWRDSYGKQLENHPRFKTLDKATKDKALEIINGNISAEAAKVKPNLGNLRPGYVIRRAKESIRQAPRRAKRQMYVPPPED